MGPAVLEGYRLCFKRYADIMPSSNSSVQGALWEVNPAGLRALDGYEGDDYKKITVSLHHDGKIVEAVTYVMKNQSAMQPPSMDYSREIAVGYREWGLDEALLRRARYDTLNVGPSAPPAPRAEGPTTNTQPQAPRRRALWDPAAQSSGALDNLISDQRKAARPKNPQR